MVSVVLHTGPGHHAPLLAKLLREIGYARKVISYYPDWQVWDEHDQVIARSRFYKPTVHLMWALWRRIPYFKRYEHPKTWEFILYDWLSSSYLPAEGVLWGWSGMSLCSLRKARRRGLRTLLELPTIHPRAWQLIAQSVYGRYSDLPSYAGLLPPAYVSRIEAEFAEADSIQVLSSFARQSCLAQNVPAHKLHVLPLGVDTELFQPKQPISHNPFRIVYVGRIALLKGIDYLLEAYRRLALPHAELWLVGPLWSEMKPILARYEGLFIHKGAHERAELVDLYNQASVIVFPTLLDSFGLVILEAMACGRPVITTIHSCGPDVITSDEGYVVPPHSVEALMEAILRLYENLTLCREVGVAARTRVLEAYTLTHYKDRIAAYLSNQMQPIHALA